MKKIISCLLMVGLLCSCENDDDQITNPLNGKWNLVNISCECEPVNLEIGEHIWMFDVSDSKLNVINNIAYQPNMILETGSYDILISDDKIIIQTVAYDYYFENEKLYVADQPEADGPLIEFIRD